MLLDTGLKQKRSRTSSERLLYVIYSIHILCPSGYLHKKEILVTFTNLANSMLSIPNVFLKDSK